ncbi:uncharacterized protein LACBIDRAFT_311072 [Laccaria bicolor S238N-H82]|uniref:Predicted protein n=1 Tax=Laccaria bicolor (strain S238N-H82 / ATCC MYA-4686) TaxID=486041 RepID=B0CZ64_LACBS|nr:uncharacterized protein LACBIDRAFT_311072 [Laccaria bicolor S238N-H82]EDR12095.1 predicted protein [Laccaria bicolor S238N-H82]|eukprot:XP_001876359.1 predicted protein [Laccaria bicolor S238N-H82]
MDDNDDFVVVVTWCHVATATWQRNDERRNVVVRRFARPSSRTNNNRATSAR